MRTLKKIEFNYLKNLTVLFLLLFCNCRSKSTQGYSDIIPQISSLIATSEASTTILSKNQKFVSIEISDREVPKCTFVHYLRNSDYEGIIKNCGKEDYERENELKSGFGRYSDKTPNNVLLFISEVIDHDKRAVLLRSIDDPFASREIFILVQIDDDKNVRFLLEREIMY